MPAGCGYGIAFLRIKLTDPRGMKPTSVASLILYMTYWLASSEWDRKDAETCQLKIQDPFVFRAGSEGPQRSFVLCLSLFSPPSSCSPEIAHKSFIHSFSKSTSNSHQVIYIPQICLHTVMGWTMPPKILYWSFNPQCDCIWNEDLQGGHKG